MKKNQLNIAKMLADSFIYSSFVRTRSMVETRLLFLDFRSDLDLEDM